MELGHVIEVLAIDADDERREEKEGGDHGELLHDVVLVVSDLPLVVVADCRDRVAGEVEPVDRSKELVVHLGEVELHVARKELAPEERTSLEIGAAVDDPADRVAGWSERPADPDARPAQLREPPLRVARVPDADVLLDLLDLLVDGVEDLEVALRDLVDEEVRDHAGRDVTFHVADALDRRRVERPPVDRRLAHREDPVVRQHEAELLVVDAVLLRHGDRGDEVTEDVVAVAFDHGSGRLVGRGCGELGHRARMQVGRRALQQLVLRRIEEVDPVVACHRGGG